MKTSKEMQLKIIDKMRENVEGDQHVYTNIQVRGKGVLSGWLDKGDSYLDFWNCEHRVKPETITINGVEIPKPLTKEEFKVRAGDDTLVYYPIPHNHLYGSIYAVRHDFKEGDIFYGIPSIAIEASKLLFGIED